MLSHPYHVDRAKIYTHEHYDNQYGMDTETIIERARYPVSNEEDHQKDNDFPGLLRAADLIGQLADPRHIDKISALFAEFTETGNPRNSAHQGCLPA